MNGLSAPLPAASCSADFPLAWSIWGSRGPGIGVPGIGVPVPTPGTFKCWALRPLLEDEEAMDSEAD